MPIRVLLISACLLATSLLATGCDGGPSSPDVAVRVGYVAMDRESQSPVVVLEELQGSRLLPIWIGVSEARSIASELERIESPRPNSHDLAKRLMDGLDGELERVVVTELSGGVYYALMVVRSKQGTIEIDARPSDAIAIALRYAAPLFVREYVFQEEHDSAFELGEGQEI